MARRGVPTTINWYLREWMEVCNLSGRGAQAKMCELTGWSKATMSQLYNGSQDYSPKIIAEAAQALHIEEYELLMLPERAMRLRRIVEDATKIAEEAAEAPTTVSEVSLARMRAEQRKKAGTQGRTGTHG